MELYRRALLARKAEVLSNLGVKFDTLAAMGRVAEEDQAQVSHDEYVSLSLNSLDFQQLGLVEEALDRIKVGDYGSCQAAATRFPANGSRRFLGRGTASPARNESLSAGGAACRHP